MSDRRSSAGDVAFGILGAGLGVALIVVSAFRFRSRADAQSLPQPSPDETPPSPSPSPTQPTRPASSAPAVLKGPCSIELSRPWDKKDAALTILVDGKPATREEAVAVCKAKGGGVRLETKGTLRPGESDEIYNALVDANIKFAAPWTTPWTTEFWKHDTSRGVDRIWDPSRNIWRHPAGPRAPKDMNRLTFMMTSPRPSNSTLPMRFQQGEGPDIPAYSLKGLIQRIKEGGRHDVTLVTAAARPVSADYARTYLFKSGITDIFDELDRKWTLGPDSALVDTSQDPDFAQYQIPADKKVARVAVSGNARGSYGRGEWSGR